MVTGTETVTVEGTQLAGGTTVPGWVTVVVEADWVTVVPG
jgi:hypothetical protein